MGLFGKKNKEKSVPFWKRAKEKQEDLEIDQENEAISEQIDQDTDNDAGEADEYEEIAASAIAERAAQEQDEIERARQAAQQAMLEEEQRKEAVALARQAALEATGAAVTEEPEAQLIAEEDAKPEKIVEEEPEQSEKMINDETPSEINEDACVTPEQSVPEESIPDSIAKAEKKGLFVKIREGLRKTKDAMVSQMQKVLGNFTKIDDDLFDELEETMIMSDLGAQTSVQICDTLRQRVKGRGVTDPQEIMGMIQEIITEMLGEDQTLECPTKPTVIMVIGVNGAGKTTTIGKLCYQLQSEGKKVLVAAADTFRAAAIDQLEVWTQRAGVDIVKHTEGSDPASVVYDAIDAAKARDCDVLICDTAGRLHNKKNLMQELAKMNRIIETRAEGCHREILLVLDATTGQNAVNQAKLFQEVADITGIVLTKLDGTAKGGIIVSIRNELGIPVKLVGVGEKIDDLQPFRAVDFVRALFESPEEE